MFLNSSLNKFPIIETDREESSEWKRKKKRRDEASFLNARVKKGGNGRGTPAEAISSVVKRVDE